MLASCWFQTGQQQAGVCFLKHNIRNEYDDWVSHNHIPFQDFKVFQSQVRSLPHGLLNSVDLHRPFKTSRQPALVVIAGRHGEQLIITLSMYPLHNSSVGRLESWAVTLGLIAALSNLIRADLVAHHPSVFA